VHKDAWVPEFAPRTFRPNARRASRTGEGRRAHPGKVAIFSTCYVNYNEPGIGHDLLKILDHNEIPYVLVEKEACCGMPKLEQGDLESVEKLKDSNIPQLVNSRARATRSSRPCRRARSCSSRSCRSCSRTTRT
jgi:Fe-S oxidoreductase